MLERDISCGFYGGKFLISFLAAPISTQHLEVTSSVTRDHQAYHKSSVQCSDFWVVLDTSDIADSWNANPATTFSPYPHKFEQASFEDKLLARQRFARSKSR